MAPHGSESSHAPWVVVATYRLLYLEGCTAIEREMRVIADTAAGIMRRAIARAGNEDLNDILVCLSDANRPGAPARIEDQ